MKKHFFQRKISGLTDSKLLALLKFRNEKNRDFIELAAAEAIRRNLLIGSAEMHPAAASLTREAPNRELEKWNWAAFFLAPLWTLANKLDVWAFFSLIPFANFIVAFYLGFRGNRLAYQKSDIESVRDFMLVQKEWTIWLIRFLAFSFLLFLFWLGMKII